MSLEPKIAVTAFVIFVICQFLDRKPGKLEREIPALFNVVIVAGVLSAVAVPASLLVWLWRAA